MGHHLIIEIIFYEWRNNKTIETAFYISAG
jgi:hypothetical protein